MFIKIIQATAITLALYTLLGLNTTVETRAVSEEVVEPAEVIVALREAFTRRQ